MIYNSLQHLKSTKEKCIEIQYNQSTYKIQLDSIQEIGKRSYQIENDIGRLLFFINI